MTTVSNVTTHSPIPNPTPSQTTSRPDTPCRSFGEWFEALSKGKQSRFLRWYFAIDRIPTLEVATVFDTSEAVNAALTASPEVWYTDLNQLTLAERVEFTCALEFGPRWAQSAGFHQVLQKTLDRLQWEPSAQPSPLKRPVAPTWAPSAEGG